MNNDVWDQIVVKSVYRLMFERDIEVEEGKLYSKSYYKHDLSEYINAPNNCAFRIIARYWIW
jgi:hypothetical protein